MLDFAAGGSTDVPNKITITFTNRSDGSQSGQAYAINQANALGQDGEVREITIDMPGVCTQVVANQIASRELQARSRPIMKCRAVVNKTMLRVNPGDAIMVTWPEYGISRMVFRVGAVNRGVRDDGKISLELLQDYFYQWRRLPPEASREHVHLGLPTVG